MVSGNSADVANATQIVDVLNAISGLYGGATTAVQNAEAIANIAANDTDRKDKLDASYRATDRQLAQQQIALDQQKVQNIAAAASQIGSSLMSAAGSYMGAAMGQGSPGGGGVTAGAATSKLANMGSGSFDFKSYANNYVSNMYGQSQLLPNNNPLTMNPMQFFNLN